MCLVWVSVVVGVFVFVRLFSFSLSLSLSLASLIHSLHSFVCGCSKTTRALCMNSIARGLKLDCRFDNFDFQFGTNCYACNIDRSHSPAQPWNFQYVHCFRHIFSFTFTLSRSFESHEWYEWFQLFLFSSIVCVLFFKLVLFVTSGAILYAAICIENIEIIEFKSSEIIQFYAQFLWTTYS